MAFYFIGISLRRQEVQDDIELITSPTFIGLFCNTLQDLWSREEKKKKKKAMKLL